MSDIMPNGYTPTPEWPDEEWAIFDTWLRGLLVTNVVYVTFTKVDGTERLMKCTLVPELLPPPTPLKEGKERRKVSEKTIIVYDLDQESWRSFLTKSVKSVTFNIGAPKFPTYPKP